MPNNNYTSYLKYIFSLKKEETVGLSVDLGILIFSLFVAYHEWHSLTADTKEWWIIVAMLILIITKSFREIIKFTRDLKEFFAYEHSELRTHKFDWPKIKPSEKEESLGARIEKITKDEYIIFSPNINNALQNNTDWQVRLNQAKSKKIKSLLRDNVEVALKFLSYQFNLSVFSKKLFFNEPKLCLSEDLNPANKEIICHQGGYYDSFLTNQIVGKYLEKKDTGKKIADTSFLVPITKNKDDETRFDDITSSTLNNHFGGSTLGITKDGYLIIWKQSGHDQISSDLLVPTGSGSCNASDLNSNNSLRATIIRNMERELTEESCQQSSCLSQPIGQTMILGFFRWLSRGGKPEFVGLTKLNHNLVEFSPNTLEVREDNGNPLLKPHYVPTVAKLLETAKLLSTQDDLSVPLAANLKFLLAYGKKNAEKLNEFLYQQTK